MNETLPDDLPKRNRRRPKRLRAKYYELTIAMILKWVDAFHARHGRWPTKDSGPVDGTLQERWINIDGALRAGSRGLQGESSLARLLAETRDVRNRHSMPPLSVDQILKWADAHYAREGEWPKKISGAIVDAPGETWSAIDAALAQGSRGLSGQSSLARLLDKHRDVPNRLALPRLTVNWILQQADAFHKVHGRWPRMNDGPIEGATRENWGAVNSALIAGSRGLPGGASLARLFAEHRDARNTRNLPPLAVEQILVWADSHWDRTGRWPKAKEGPILEAPGETWLSVDAALRSGSRGLTGASSLARLLSEHRGVRNDQALPAVTVEQILNWADAFRLRHERWPTNKDGRNEGMVNEIPSGVSTAERPWPH